MLIICAFYIGRYDTWQYLAAIEKYCAANHTIAAIAASQNYIPANLTIP
jgi:hypothetical protein